MELHFRNSYDGTSLISVAIMFYSPSTCANYGSWGTRGWWNIAPGGEAYVLNTNNQYAAFYAEATNGAIWAGNYGPVYVHPYAFDSCVDIGDNNPATRVVGMRLVDMDGFSRYTVNLTA
jgi:Protein of unknown function (DUF1036)